MRPPQAAAALALAVIPLPLLADTVTLNPDADTGLIEGPEDDYNQGTENDIPVGTFGEMNSAFDSRGLLRFDIASAVPACSTITGGRFVMTVSKTPDTGAVGSAFDFHRMTASWTEGAGRGKNPGGRPAREGETTWNNREHATLPWTNPGAQGDFASAVSATQNVTGNGGYTFELTAAGIADVQAMLDAPATNFGWLFKTAAEGTEKTARRWYTREAPLHPVPSVQGPPPELIVDFTPPNPVTPPEVTMFSSDGTNLSLQFVASAGLNYEVQSSSSLLDSGWSTVETFNPLADGTLSSTIPIVDPKRTFVRVLASDN